MSCACAAARGQAYFDDARAAREFAFGLGYTHLFLDGSNSRALEEQGGIRLDGRVSWPVSEMQPNFRLGAGLALSSFVSERDRDFEDEVDDGDDGWFFYGSDDWDQLFIIEPEIQASWRLPAGDDLYLEPGFGASLLGGNFVRGEEFFGFVDEDIDRWSLGAAGRIFLRGAFVRGRWSFGLEGSYSFGWLHFGDDIGGDIQRGHLGFYVARAF